MESSGAVGGVALAAVAGYLRRSAGRPESLDYKADAGVAGMTWMKRPFTGAVAVLLLTGTVRAGVGDPQIRTDDPWYPGELACSTFERLFATQAEAFRRVVGHPPATEEERALASWLWRNTHYAHGEEGAEDLWGAGFTSGGDLRTREYWTGLFAHGFGLCGTTHSQWTAEMEALLGHGRGRGVGVAGHNAFEVFLTGGAYGKGRWALLDHDLSTVIFDPEGRRLLSIAEIGRDLDRLIDRGFRPDRQRGWLVCGLAPQDGRSYAAFQTAEHLPGYAGPPPMVALRRGETLRRYLHPGLEDGRTFAFWGRNYGTEGIPGPERSISWVNQPDAMHGSKSGAGYHPGQARFGNAVFTYRPDFASGDYREGLVAETARSVTFAFASPYIIAATPPNDQPWGIYDDGGRNGLVATGRGEWGVAISTDRGATWTEPRPLSPTGLDLTDAAKGHRQYWLRLDAGAGALRGSDLTFTTVCQANAAVLPRLKDEGTRVTFAASGRAVVSAGPNIDQARPSVIAGGFGTPRVTMELATPRGEPVVSVYAAAHVLSSNPPDPGVKYQIELSTDGGKTWRPVVADWTIPRRGEEPPESWSQSFCYGSTSVDEAGPSAVRVRFRNDGGKAYARCEVHLAYRVGGPRDATEVAFAWTDDTGPHQAAYRFPGDFGTWDLPTGRRVVTRWVELRPVVSPP